MREFYGRYMSSSVTGPTSGEAPAPSEQPDTSELVDDIMDAGVLKESREKGAELFGGSPLIGTGSNRV